MKGGLLSAWLTEVIIVSYRAVKQGGGNQPIAHLPLPSTYVSTMIVYGGLGLLPDSASPFATLVGWGLVVATLLNLWSPGGKVKSGAGTAGTPAQQQAAAAAFAPVGFGTNTPAAAKQPTPLTRGVGKVGSKLSQGIF